MTEQQTSTLNGHIYRDATGWQIVWDMPDWDISGPFATKEAAASYKRDMRRIFDPKWRHWT